MNFILVTFQSHFCVTRSISSVCVKFRILGPLNPPLQHKICEGMLFIIPRARSRPEKVRKLLEDGGLIKEHRIYAASDRHWTSCDSQM